MVSGDCCQPDKPLPCKIQVTEPGCDAVESQTTLLAALVPMSEGGNCDCPCAPFAWMASSRTARGVWAGFDDPNPIVVEEEFIS